MSHKVVKAPPQPVRKANGIRKLAAPKTLNTIVVSPQQSAHKYLNGIRQPD
jgi:hypothetical protein